MGSFYSNGGGGGGGVRGGRGGADSSTIFDGASGGRGGSSRVTSAAELGSQIVGGGAPHGSGFIVVVPLVVGQPKPTLLASGCRADRSIYDSFTVQAGATQMITVTKGGAGRSDGPEARGGDVEPSSHRVELDTSVKLIAAPASGTATCRALRRSCHGRWASCSPPSWGASKITSDSRSSPRPRQARRCAHRRPARGARPDLAGSVHPRLQRGRPRPCAVRPSGARRCLRPELSPTELPEGNPFDYDLEPLPLDRCLPEPGSVDDRVTEGALVLFSIPVEFLSERPVALEVTCDSGERERVIVDL